MSMKLVAGLFLPTAVFVAFSLIVWWGRKRLLGWINSILLERAQRLASARLRRIGSRQAVMLSKLLVRVVSLALIIGAVGVWITALLDALPATHEWARQIERALLHEVVMLIESALGALPGMGIVAIILLLTKVAQELFAHYFHSIETGEIRSELLDAVTAQTTRRLSGVALWIAALIIAYPYIPGSETSAFKGVTILAGLMLSLGSTNLVGQFVNGLVLIYTRAVRPGDFVTIDEVEGTIEKLGLFASAIRTANDELVWRPNSALAAGLRNNSRPSDDSVVRFTTQVTIGYDAPWRQVRDLLLGAAAETASIRKDPAPFVRQVALEDFYVRYELVFAPAVPAQRQAILSELHEHILDRFHSAGVQIMSPHYNADPMSVKMPPRGRQKDVPDEAASN